MSAYVMFLGRQRSYWTDWFNPQGYRHCFPFWFDGDADHWVIAENNHDRLNVILLKPHEFDHWLLVMQRAGCSCLQVERKSSPHFFFRLGLWCVPFTAHAVGSRSRAFRPIALWRDLVRDGARPAFVGRPKDFRDNDEVTKGPARKPRSRSQAST